jgi:hypothetical protein
MFLEQALVLHYHQRQIGDAWLFGDPDRFSLDAGGDRRQEQQPDQQCN